MMFRPSANASVIKEAADHLESRLAPFEAAAPSVAEAVPLSPPADGFDDGRLAALEVPGSRSFACMGELVGQHAGGLGGTVHRTC